MWLFTTFGFYSIVLKPGEQDLTVRARVAADLDALREKYLPELSAARTIPDTDYPYRATISHQAFARGLAGMGEDIHYSSFKDEINANLGEERGHVYADVWSVLHKLEAENKPGRAPHKGPAVFGTRQTFGGIVMDCDGKVLLREPFNHMGGYVWTFPKDLPRSREPPEETALRAVLQKTGCRARIVDRIPGIYNGDTTSSSYYLMMFESQNGSTGRGSKAVLWVTREEAETRIKMSSSVYGRARDLEVLSNAYTLYEQRYRQGRLNDDEIDQVENRILTCAALRFDGYRYIDETGFDAGAAVERYLSVGELPASPLDQICILFVMQRRLMKWSGSALAKTAPEWRAYRELFLQTCRYCIPPEYRYAECSQRWLSEFLPKLNECMALVQVIHTAAQYQDSPV